MYGKSVLSQFSALRPGQRSLLFGKSGFALHSMIVSAGYERAREGYDWHGLKRGKSQWVLLQHTLSGQGRLVFEGRTYAATPGTTMLLHVPHDHRYFLPAGGKWEYFFLCFGGSEMVRVWRWAVSRLGPLAGGSGAQPLQQAAAATCLSVLREEIATPWQASAAAYEIGTRLLEAATPRGLAGRADPRPPAVAAAIDYCRQNLRRSIGVAQLAAAAGLSRYYFTRLFQACEGVSPGEYISRQRMREAVRLLQAGGEPIKSIAAAVGFADVSYFCKVFRRTFDVSPAQFRRSGTY